MHLLFVKSESTFTYFEATRSYIGKHGKPMFLYSDKASVFRVNNKHATTGPGEAQFARVMRSLNITLLCAETSQAKGRVERAYLTFQDGQNRGVDSGNGKPFCSGSDSGRPDGY
ncbi:hypothetical protein EC2021H102_47070 [Escherichia coli]